MFKPVLACCHKGLLKAATGSYNKIAKADMIT